MGLIAALVLVGVLFAIFFSAWLGIGLVVLVLAWVVAGAGMSSWGESLSTRDADDRRR
jgi:hypothetical protein